VIRQNKNVTSYPAMQGKQSLTTYGVVLVGDKIAEKDKVGKEHLRVPSALKIARIGGATFKSEG